MKAYNLFTGKTDDPSLTASDGTAAGVSETLNGISISDVIVTVINPNGSSVQLWSSLNRKPYEWAPVGGPLLTSDQIPLVLQSGNAYHFSSSSTGAEVYVQAAPGCVEFDGSETAGLS